MMKKRGTAKPLTVFIDYCCFNVSIVIARLQIDQDNVNEQWSVDKLCRKLNGLPYTDSSNFYVNSIVLSHSVRARELIVGPRCLRRMVREKDFLAYSWCDHIQHHGQSVTCLALIRS